MCIHKNTYKIYTFVLKQLEFTNITLEFQIMFVCYHAVIQILISRPDSSMTSTLYKLITYLFTYLMCESTFHCWQRKPMYIMQQVQLSCETETK